MSAFDKVSRYHRNCDALVATANFLTATQRKKIPTFRHLGL
jgi:hypothetical protein